MFALTFNYTWNDVTTTSSGGAHLSISNFVSVVKTKFGRIKTSMRLHQSVDNDKVTITGSCKAQRFAQLFKFCSIFDQEFQVLREKAIFKTQFSRRGHRSGRLKDSTNLMDQGYLAYLK